MYHDVHDVLESLPLFGALPAETRRQLVLAGSIRTYETGATLFVSGSEPEGVLIVLDGTIRVVRSHSGRQQVVHSETRGGTLAEVPFFSGGTLPATAVAAEPSRCLVLHADALRRLIAADGALATLFLRRLAQRVRVLVDRLDRVAGQHVLARVAGFIRARTLHTNTDVISLGMSQAALAEELGTAREVVVRALAQLRADGIVESIGRGRFRVTDADRLRAVAETWA